VEARWNTFYNCSATITGNAIQISGEDAGVSNNIIANCGGGQGAVVLIGGTNHPTTGCNLFWENEGGNYFLDWSPASTDVEADPRFCAPESGDFTLHTNSPAAPGNAGGCGSMGAHEVGCGVVSVEDDSWASVKARYR
jgi:hypothetical protein